MTARKTTLLFTLLSLMSSFWLGCNLWPVRWESLTHAHRFRLILPDYLEPTEDLAPGAALQYQNRRREIFLAVHYAALDSLYEKRPDYSTEDYYDFHVRNLLDPMRQTEASAIDTVQAANLSGLGGTFSGFYEQDQLHFWLWVLEGEAHLYQVLLWTPESKRPQVEADVRRILTSFEELTPDP